MNTLARLVGLTLALTLLLIVGCALGGRWLAQQGDLLRQDYLSSKRVQFTTAVRALNGGNGAGTEQTLRTIMEICDVQIIDEQPDGANPSAPKNEWSFLATTPNANAETSRTIVVRVNPPTLFRLVGYYQRAAVGLFLAVGMLLVGLSVVLILSWSRGRDGHVARKQGWAAGVAEMSSLTRLARVSVEQGAALEREKNERTRIQEDLNFQQTLLNRALEEKIRLGHDLHDGIIQSLYATGLTLEAAKVSFGVDPQQTRQHLDTALLTLNGTIRDVRSYILGLSPEELNQQSFEQSVKTIADTLGAGQTIKFNIKIDGNAAARLTDGQSTDLAQIVREGISNAIRHGRASEIAVRLEDNESELCLLVQDNGKGFNMDTIVKGHGISNIQSRGDRLRGSVRYSSVLGTGTRIVITLPVKRAISA